MSIKQHYQTASQNISAERDRAINAEKDRVTREQIIPKNAEIDQWKNDAINALTTKLNQDIAQLQQKYTEEKTEIIKASEAKKTEFANQVIYTATSIVSAQYDKALSSLEKIMSEIKE